MEAVSVLRKAYYDKLKGATPYPVYQKYTPAEIDAPLYIVIDDVSSTEDSPKKQLSESVIMRVAIMSNTVISDSYVNPDAVADTIRKLIYSDDRTCLIDVPEPYQTWIDRKSNDSQTINLSPSQIFTNHFLTFEHIFITHN